MKKTILLSIFVLLLSFNSVLGLSATDLESYWPFDETSGDVTDIWNGHDLSVTGASQGVDPAIINKSDWLDGTGGFS